MSGSLSGALGMLAGHLWPALATAPALGILIGAASCGGRSNRAVTLSFGLFWCVLAGGGLAVAGLEWVPGRYGLWFEMGALLLGAYTIGCTLGCGVRALVRRNDVPDGRPNVSA